MKLCTKCHGTGEYLGMGFMLTACDCDEHVEAKTKPVAISLDKIDRRSKSYRKAIDEIMDINPSITRTEATRMFDEAYVNG